MVIVTRAKWERMEKPTDNEDLGRISMHLYRSYTLFPGPGLGDAWIAKSKDTLDD